METTKICKTCLKDVCCTGLSLFNSCVVLIKLRQSHTELERGIQDGTSAEPELETLHCINKVCYTFINTRLDVV